MGKRIGSGDYQFELVEDWPKIEIGGGISDVTTDAQGRVYAGVRNTQDTGKPGNIFGGGGHVPVLDRDGNLVANWGNICESPHGIWMSPSGEIYLADTAAHTVTKHAPSGEVLLTLGTRGQPGADGAPFNMPTHAVEAPNGDIFVSDGYAQNRIHRFSAKGEHILTFGGGDSVFIHRRFGTGPAGGTPGTAPGEFNVPHDVFVDKGSRVYVLDRENNRWQVFSADGVLESVLDGLDHPNKIVLDAVGNFNMVGAGGVEVRKPDGELVARFGEKGDAPGQFIATVHGGWIDDQGSLYTAEAGFNNRLQKFARV